MALMDTVKQMMKGRSEAVERGIDTAVGHLGRYSEQLKRQAEAVKAQARTLDPDRGDPGRTTMEPFVEPPTGAAPAGPAPTAATPTPPVTPPVAPEGPSLRGDLVDDGEPPTGAPPA